jgi:hypothetical protein
MKTVVVLLLALLGVAAAFFRPMAPYQIENPTPAFIADNKDVALDNPLIPEDKNIQPARKCGFCIGVSNKEKEDSVALVVKDDHCGVERHILLL